MVKSVRDDLNLIFLQSYGMATHGQRQIMFAQIAVFLDHSKFRCLVDKFAGNSHVKHFTCWNQLLTLLMFGQLSVRENSSDLDVVRIKAAWQ